MAKQVRLYEIPKVLEKANILDDSILKDYNNSIASYSEKARQTLSHFNKADGDLTGSSPFMQVHLLNSGLLKRARLAARADLEKATFLDNNFLAGLYTDFGLALRSAGDSYKPNNIPSKLLAEQLKIRGINLGNGKLIPLNSLSLEENDNSDYGLVFVLNEKADKDSILDLSFYKWDYQRNEGLARACLGRYQYWSSYGEQLAVSSGDGRVVLVRRRRR
jgi:hypothetical protein